MMLEAVSTFETSENLHAKLRGATSQKTVNFILEENIKPKLLSSSASETNMFNIIER